MENVRVWADGFGRWHASVPISDPQREAREALALIQAELNERSESPSYRLTVTRERVTNHGTAIYGEV